MCGANNNNIFTFGTHIWDLESGSPGQGHDTERCRRKAAQEIMKDISDKEDLDGYSASNSRFLHLRPPCAYMSFSHLSVFEKMHAKETVPEGNGSAVEYGEHFSIFQRTCG